MTIQERLKRSNLIMLVVPVLIAGVYLPTIQAVHSLMKLDLAFVLGAAILLGLEGTRKLMAQQEAKH